MATPSMPPPPGMAPNAGPPQSAPIAASPAPAQSDGVARQAAFQTLQIVQNARQLAQQFPEVAPLVRQINDLMTQVQMKIASATSAGEVEAPPVG